MSAKPKKKVEPRAQRPEAVPAAVDSAAAAAAVPAVAVASHQGPSLEHQLLATQQQLRELGQHLKALEGMLSEKERLEVGLRHQLAVAKSDLATLQETYRCVGPGTVSAANRIDLLKRRLPGMVSPLVRIARRFR